MIPSKDTSDPFTVSFIWDEHALQQALPEIHTSIDQLRLRIKGKGRQIPPWAIAKVVHLHTLLSQLDYSKMKSTIVPEKVAQLFDESMKRSGHAKYKLNPSKMFIALMYVVGVEKFREKYLDELIRNSKKRFGDQYFGTW